MKQSSFGNAAAKHRSIDVGANLLGQWMGEQAKLKKETARYAVVLAGSLAIGLTFVPWLWGLGTTATQRASKLSQETKALNDQLQITDTARKAAEPAAVVSSMLDRTRASFDFVRATVERPLRSGNARMVLGNVRCEVAAAEAHLSVQAFAEDEAAADSFATAVADEGSKVDAITNSKPSTLLGPSGLSFQYEKRVGVPK